jgi:hypothetical protein
MMVMVMEFTLIEDQVLQSWKIRKRKTKLAQGKGIIDRDRGCDWVYDR